jgi:uncharacterized protein
MVGYEHRFYRESMGKGRFVTFVVQYKDSDLWIGVDADSYTDAIPDYAKQQLVDLRNELERFIAIFPDFARTFSPIEIPASAPVIATRMANAAQKAGTGPMAAVAGAFAEFIGNRLMAVFGMNEIVVENGGDIFLVLKDSLVLSIYAGESPLSGKIGIEIFPNQTPIGICTSAGTVGPSISFGNADAVMVACTDTATADAYATTLGNKVKTADDIELVLASYESNPDIQSVCIICDGRLGIRGNFPLRMIQS